MGTSLPLTFQKLNKCNFENMFHLGHLTDENNKHSISVLEGGEV
jgi:hypothetical protein